MYADPANTGGARWWDGNAWSGLEDSARYGPPTGRPAANPPPAQPTPLPPAEPQVVVKKQRGCLWWIGLAVVIIVVLAVIVAIVEASDENSNEGSSNRPPAEPLCEQLERSIESDIDTGLEAAAVGNTAEADAVWSDLSGHVDEATALECDWADEVIGEGAWSYGPTETHPGLTITIRESDAIGWANGKPGPIDFLDGIAGDCAFLLEEQDRAFAELDSSWNQPDLRVRELTNWIYAMDLYAAGGC